MHPASVAVLLLSAVSAKAAGGYRAAFAEYGAVSPCGQGSCGLATKRANLEAYARLAQQAASQGAQVIVFPEYGVTGFSSAPASQWSGYSEPVPTVTGRQVPCDMATTPPFSSAPAVVTLSCIARNSSIAVVANIADQPAPNTLHNTDVAFDTDGAYLAKYNKLNLWGESNMKAPESCPAEPVQFVTSFGTKFGLGTCADLIYRAPMAGRGAGSVRDFLVPSAWSNSMAQMQVMAWAQAFSLLHGVNLVLANHRAPSMSGSGAWTSGRTLASVYSLGGGDKLRVVDFPAASAVSGAVPLRPPPELRSGKSYPWAFAALAEGARVCSGAVCCEARNVSGDAAGFSLAVLDGIDSGGDTEWAAQVCALLPCRQPSARCLDYQLPAGTLSTAHLLASGLAADAVIFPEVLGKAPSGGQTLLAPGGAGDDAFVQDAAGAGLGMRASAGLLSAAIYARRFSLDVLPYSC
eukprot:TRINITY_DN56544_c0_g1_i1.p1 TRINITY_DN56544_c0_g1~~TRINITY_DN56544_c0_g1_i1.p1  ORF type:complete len:464 (+),score=58.31 TRINITY_DN56544_c0_g1_i1:91-1482(+)